MAEEHPAPSHTMMLRPPGCRHPLNHCPCAVTVTRPAAPRLSCSDTPWLFRQAGLSRLGSASGARGLPPHPVQPPAL